MVLSIKHNICKRVYLKENKNITFMSIKNIRVVINSKCKIMYPVIKYFLNVIGFHGFI